jgi:chloramphenicol-sensitive protein RarD
VDERRAGVGAGLGAYALWGLFPLYFPLLEPAGGLEIVAHRVAWSLLFVGLLLTVRRNWGQVRAAVRRPRSLLVLAAAAVLIAVNWLVYVYAVNSGHVVEASLGYFINPLVSVVLGVFVFRERLRWLQWVAVGIAVVAVVVLTADYGQPPWIALTLALTFGLYGLLKKLVRVEATPGLFLETAVVVLTVDYGQPPWIALTLALTFGLYGLLKKLVRVEATPGLFLETAVVVVPALVVMGVMEGNGDAAFGHAGVGHALLLAGSGVATAVPLLLFAAAARRVPLSTIGLMQYLTPLMQLAIGVFVYSEPMPPARLVGFAIVWLALAVFTVDMLRATRTARRTPAEQVPAVV